VAGAFAGFLAGARAGAFAGAVAGAFAVAGTLVSIYIAWQAMKGNEKYSLIRNIAVAFAATGGTSFRNANLTNANFTQATLKSTDFRNAILTLTRWHQATMLDRVRPGKTYLHNSQVRQLLVTGQGQDKNFDRENLRGINLQTANLADASFIGTDLSKANLQDADLSRAKLKQTQLDATDFTGATLTGAFIEDWGITNTTKLHGVSCEYVFMRLPTKENPDPLRKPDNNKEVFADGEFGDFIKPIFDTLDLYHNQGVDPRAIAISFKQLAENHPEADLRIVGMEVRGEDKFLLRAKTAPKADKSELNAEYFANYNQLKNLPAREIKLLLVEKDNQIRRLENMVTTALERPSFYSNIQVEEVGTVNQNQGGINQSANNSQFGQGQQAAQGGENQLSMNKNNDENYNTKYNFPNSREFNVVDKAESGSQQIVNNHPNSAPEKKQNLAEAAAEIQQLLEQLSQSYPTNTNSEKMVLAIEAKKHVENNPTLMQKIISALEAGGTAALEQLLSHPAASFVIGVFEDFKKNSK
ncbi:pentapeptide repeat-containing protein, partial [Nostoc sp. NZL]|uniref:pentapeptide repeat-containing protein n=1 Tax=Nostoc sp. NZL TaxID=2650612 RepID=UPI0018C5F035